MLKNNLLVVNITTSSTNKMGVSIMNIDIYILCFLIVIMFEFVIIQMLYIKNKELRKEIKYLEKIKGRE